MIKINLIPVRVARKRENIRQEVSVAVLSLILLIIIGGYFYFSLLKKVGKVETNLRTVNKNIQRLKKIENEVEKYKKQKNIIEQKLETINTLEKGKKGPVHVLDEICTRIPDKLWLTLLDEKNLQLKLEGRALDNETIALFMTKLGKSSYFKNVELKIAKKRKVETLLLKEFTIICRIVFSEEKSK